MAISGSRNEIAFNCKQHKAESRDKESNKESKEESKDTKKARTPVN
jgi:hypothetical protein